MTRPLDGVRVLDFSNLLPGPLASLILAEAGAEVIKLERPPGGDDMRRLDVDFAMLNRGKRSLAIDLKDPAARDRLRPLIESADVVVEQFRPGVMDRLGLGWEDLRAINPRLVYCSINGYGAEGPKAQDVGHDLTYCAEAGLLSQSGDADGAPCMPPALMADIGAGSYPAVMNILLGLIQRDRTGEGVHVEVAMYDNLFPFLYPAIASAYGRGHWPQPGDALETGASPRYSLYRTLDGRYLAAAPFEEKFWRAFCEVIGLADHLRPADDWPRTKAAVAELIAAHTAEDWQAAFAGRECASAIVRSFEEAVADPHFAARRLLDHRVDAGGRDLPALPVPIASAFREPPASRSAPALGEADDLVAR
jgi:alpha-methylacyl-CoA racemase